MLSQDAIQHIEDNSAAKAALAHLIDLKDADKSEIIDGLLIPNNYNLASIEKLLPTPFAFKASLKTTSIADWLTYVNNCASEETGIYIDKEGMTATAIIDQGTHIYPQWGKHRAQLGMVKTPEFADLLRYEGSHLSQKTMVDLILDWEDCITCHIEPEIQDGDKTAEPQQLIYKKALQSFRRLSIDQISRLEQNQNDASGSVEQKSAYNVSAQGTTPINKIVMTTPAWEGLNPIKITLMLRYGKTNNDVIVNYRIIKLAQIHEERAQAFKAMIDEGITHDAITPVIASISYQQ